MANFFSHMNKDLICQTNNWVKCNDTWSRTYPHTQTYSSWRFYLWGHALLKHLKRNMIYESVYILSSFCTCATYHFDMQMSLRSMNWGILWRDCTMLHDLSMINYHSKLLRWIYDRTNFSCLYTLITFIAKVRIVVSLLLSRNVYGVVLLLLMSSFQHFATSCITFIQVASV